MSLNSSQLCKNPSKCCPSKASASRWAGEALLVPHAVVEKAVLPFFSSARQAVEKVVGTGECAWESVNGVCTTECAWESVNGVCTTQGLVSTQGCALPCCLKLLLSQRAGFKVTLFMCLLKASLYTKDPIWVTFYFFPPQQLHTSGVVEVGAY